MRTSSPPRTPPLPKPPRTLLDCAIRLHSYTSDVNPKARFPYHVITTRPTLQILKSYKIREYDPASHHTQCSIEQELNFILLCAVAEGETLPTSSGE